MSTTTNLETLKINYLSQEQYDQAVAQGDINNNELYLTPALDTITDVTVDGTSVVSDGVAKITMPTEIDPVFSASAAKNITSSDISSWNAKSDFSGSYNDLSNKPTIPTRYVRALSRDVSVTLGTQSVKAMLYVFGGTATSRGSLLISGYTTAATDIQTIGGSLTDIGMSVSGQNVIITNNSAYSIVYGIDVYSGTLTIT